MEIGVRARPREGCDVRLARSPSGLTDRACSLPPLCSFRSTALARRSGRGSSGGPGDLAAGVKASLAERSVSGRNPGCHSQVQGERQRAAAWRSPHPAFLYTRSTVRAYGGEEAWRAQRGGRPLQAFCRVTSQNVSPRAQHDLRRQRNFSLVRRVDAVPVRARWGRPLAALAGSFVFSRFLGTSSPTGGRRGGTHSNPTTRSLPYLFVGSGGGFFPSKPWCSTAPARPLFDAPALGASDRGSRAPSSVRGSDTSEVASPRPERA